MAEVIISMLPVGQGAMNLIEVYADDSFKQLISLSLIDCGAVSTSREECKMSIDYVVSKMANRAERCDGIIFDLVMFTHRDRDHWNLFKKLFYNFYGPKFKVKTGQSSYSHNLQYVVNEDYLSGSHTIFQEEYFLNENIFDSSATYRRNIYGDDFSYDISISHYADHKSVSVKYINESSNGCNLVAPSIVSISHFWEFGDTKNPDDIIDSVIISLHGISKTFQFRLKGINLVCINYYEEVIIGKLEQISLEEPRTEFWWWNLTEQIHKRECKHIFDAFGVEDGIFFDIMEQAHSNFYRTKEYIEQYMTAIPDPGFIKPISQLITGGNINQKGKSFGSTYELASAMSRNVREAVSGSEYKLFPNFMLKILERINIEKLGSEDTWLYNTANNATSAVSLLWDENLNKPICLFTGDATCHTFYHILIKTEDFKFLHNAVWTAPHHGAYRTIAGIIATEEGNSEIYPTVLAKMQPRAMVISAGYLNRHGHPHYSFIMMTHEYFEYNGKKCELHDVCYNRNDTNVGEWQHEWCNTPLFTSVFFMQDYPHFMNCQLLYRVDGTFFNSSKELYVSKEQKHHSLIKAPENSPLVCEIIEKNLSETEIPDKQLFWHR